MEKMRRTAGVAGFLHPATGLYRPDGSRWCLARLASGSGRWLGHGPDDRTARRPELGRLLATRATPPARRAAALPTYGGATVPRFLWAARKTYMGVGKYQRMRQFLRRAQHGFRNRVHRHTPYLPIRSRLTYNYIDFQWAFRKRDDYISVMEQAIDVLKQREAVPW